MNKELKKIANSFAEEHGSDAIYPAHLFKAILHQEIGLVHFLETELDKDYYYLQDWADVQMQMAPKSARPMRDLEYAEESLAVMDEAENYQRKFGLDECTDLCVLASLVTPGVGFPFDVLKTLPLTPAEISEKVGNGISVEAPDMGSTPTATSSGKGGLGTFRSITESTTHVGFQAGIFGGRQLSRLLSVEALLGMGGQTQTALDCCPYWLSTDGQRSFAPVLGKQGNYYRDLEAKTRWMRFGLQANFDVLSLLTKPTTRWSVTLSPQVSAVTTRTKHLAAGYEQEFSRQWHLGLGGQAAVGYRITQNIGVQLYGGVTCLTGDRFDNIPKYHHKSNFIYEGGLKVAYHFNNSK